MKDLERSIELACPHDGWYNGNPLLMQANGTYLDYRHRLVAWVEKGKMNPNDLANLDAIWNEIPLEEKRARRAKVLKDLEFNPLRLRDGKIEMVTTP